MQDHLGSVRVLVSDKKLSDIVGGAPTNFRCEILSYSNTYAFGMLEPGRNFNTTQSRFGYNNKESDPEIYGEKNEYNYGFRIYDARAGRFLSVDPLSRSFPWVTPYQFAGNKPVWAIDIDGLEEGFATDKYNEKTGKYVRFYSPNMGELGKDDIGKIQYQYSDGSKAFGDASESELNIVRDLRKGVEDLNAGLTKEAFLQKTKLLEGPTKAPTETGNKKTKTILNTPAGENTLFNEDIKAIESLAKENKVMKVEIKLGEGGEEAVKAVQNQVQGIVGKNVLVQVKLTESLSSGSFDYVPVEINIEFLKPKFPPTKPEEKPSK